ncbi:PAS domain S-box [Candidatus Methanoperedens nitroreducens]|uniref:histidine kinase n=1 Tax=Candidatus Methanoperedens nitratireducens TaxID=1392998 RepID=A0A062UWT9_9EURY|nr:ATP-binding protein [Candidatus Methanoperedens nitroreducens]KCZ71451.1 PAS domain S-box [Candidatus Methanoperedens nitroreducens]MDJ1421079.1 ATP-binding protein [Candidatus Methanoperedens sp.]
MGTLLRVLIIEDSEDDVLLVVRELRRGGYDPVFERVDTAEAMSEALEKKTWDVIISDYVMPQFSSLEALRLLQKSGLDLPFIIVSGKIGEDTAVEAMKAGANDYIMKDNLARLVPAIEREMREAEVRREKKRADEKLRRAYDELEIRVQERTEELAKANEALQAIINNSTAVIYVKDTQGRYIMVNRRYENLLHIKSEQIKGKTDYDIFPKEMADAVRANDQKVLQARVPLEFDEVIQQDDGLHTYIAIKFPLYDPAGIPYAVCGISTDITERKRTEQALLESEQRYRSLFENMLHGFAYCKMLFDDRGRPVDFIYLNVNSAFERLTGLKNVVGKKVTEIIPGIKESYPELFEIYGRVALTGRPEKFEIDFKPLGIWLSISVYSTQREHFVAVFDNITERKLAEEELRRSNAELEQFAYIAAHDLQEPLRMISIFTQLLAKRYKGRLDKDADEFITYAVDGARHMQQMIEDLLKYSRIGTSGRQLEPSNLEDIFDQTVANLKAAIEENNAEVAHDPLPTVMADASQMVELFQNLIDNAIKFRREEPPQVHVSARREGNEWVLSVRDNGIGISPEFMGSLFQLFQREHVAKYPGTGVGLAICRRIVERHRGRIWAESEVGKGSTFYFTIPVRKFV